jgi:hypothetical protein
LDLPLVIDLESFNPYLKFFYGGILCRLLLTRLSLQFDGFLPCLVKASLVHLLKLKQMSLACRVI